MINSGFLGSGEADHRLKADLVDYVLSISEDVVLASPEEIDPGAWVAVVGGMGSPVAALEKGIFNAPTRAFEALEQAIGINFSAVIPLELGSGNSIAPMSVAAHKGIPIVDGTAGRRSLRMTTYAIYGVPISPFTLANESDVSVVLYTDRPDQIERLARAITIEFGMVAGFATHAMQDEVLRKVAISGTLSQAERVGAALRRARQDGSDPIVALHTLVGGWIIIRGTIAQVSAETRAGFDFGSFIVRADTGQTGWTSRREHDRVGAWETHRHGPRHDLLPTRRWAAGDERGRARRHAGGFFRDESTCQMADAAGGPGVCPGPGEDRLHRPLRIDRDAAAEGKKLNALKPVV
jgi:DUF917 family protein